jgi:formylglycine-generating enzyme required for sulfatase activity
VELALARGYLTPEQVQQALAHQVALAARGEPVHVLGVLGMLLTPAQTAELRVAYQGGIDLSRSYDPERAWSPPSPDDSDATLVAHPGLTPTNQSGSYVLPPTNQSGSYVLPPTNQSGSYVLPGAQAGCSSTVGGGGRRGYAGAGGPTHADSSRSGTFGGSGPDRSVWKEGAEVDGYRIVSELGKGGMGVVFLVERGEEGGRYALKTISLDAGDEMLSRFRREGEVQARVYGHPNVVGVRSAGEALGCLYIVMDLARGGDLKDRLRQGPLPPLEAASLVAPLARGLHHCHQHGVLHRDLKPANVMFDAEGTPKLCDFGVARDLDAQSLTATGTMLGTPAYMPPEQVEGDKRAMDARTDVYGMGAILYCCLTGRAPFLGETAMNIVKKVLTDEPDLPRDLRPEIPEGLERVCMKALAKDRDERYASAEDLADDLERVARGEAPRVGALPRRRAGGRRLALGAGLALIVACGAVGWAVFGSGTEDLPPPPPPEAPVAIDPVLEIDLEDWLLVASDQTLLEIPVRVEGTGVHVTVGGERVTVEPAQGVLVVPLGVGINEIVVSAERDKAPAQRRVVVRLPGNLRPATPEEEPQLWRSAAVDPDDGSVLLLVPGGEFEYRHLPEGMAWEPGEESPATVVVEPFLLGKYEVSYEQYRTFEREYERSGGADAAAVKLPAVIGIEAPEVEGGAWSPTDGTDDEQVAAYKVSCLGAEEYCRWVGLRLPTPAEREFAAGGGDEYRRFPWGDEEDPLRANTVGGADSCPIVASVRGFPQDVGRWGHQQLHGNVMEWTSSGDSLLDDAERSEWQYGSSWDDPITRGQWNDRHPSSVTRHQVDTGFRVACSLSGR